MQPVLHTPRLLMFPCGNTDVDLLHRHWTAPEVRRYLWDGRVIGRDTVEALVHDSMASSRHHGYGLWVLRRQPDGVFQGVCGLRDGVLTWPELLYSIPALHWGLGLATESASGVLRYAFETLGLRTIAASVDRPNQASSRVLEKLGFSVTAERLINGNPIVYHALSAPRRIAEDASDNAIRGEG